MTKTIISGTQFSGVTLTSAVYGNPVTVASNAIVSVASGGALDGASPTAWTLFNRGTIESGNSYGVYLHAGGAITNASGATITGTIAVDITGAHGSVVNYGIIGSSLAAGSGGGIYLHNGGAITNQSGGTITAAGGAAISALASGGAPIVVNDGYIGDTDLGCGIYMRVGGVVTNLSGGTIVSHLYGVDIKGDPGTVVNAGRIIEAVGTGTDGAINLLNGGVVTNRSGGIVSGQYGVRISGGAATLVNAGGITGTADAVRFATGFANTLIVDPGAAFSGTVNGGNTIGATFVSTLELAAGSGSNTLSGLGTQFIDFAQVMVEAGASWTLTSGSLAAGGTLTDAGTLINAGSLNSYVTLLAGAYLLNEATGTIAGGVIAVGTAGRVTNLGSIESSVEAVYLKSGGTVVNGSVTDTTALLSGSAGGVLIQNDGGAVGNDGTIIGGSFAGVFIGGGAGTIVNGSTSDRAAVIASDNTGVEMQDAGTVANYGTISAGGAFAVDIAGAGSVTNAGTMQANTGVQIGGAGVVANTGTIIGAYTGGDGVVVAAGGTVTNGSASNTSAAITGGLYGVKISGSSGTVTNDGSIAGTGQSGVYITGSGPVINGSNADTTAAITGGEIGVVLKGTGTVINYGTILGTQAAGIVLVAGGTVINGSTSDTAALVASTVGGIAGVNLETNATVINFGTIQSGGFFGAAFRGGTFTNFGTVIGGTGLFGTGETAVNDGIVIGVGTATGDAGVEMTGGTLTNAGTIIGASGTAAQLPGVLLVVDPGASFGGGIVQGITGTNSTLELASGTSAGTLTGLGSRYLNFTRITVDPGARWTLASDTIGSGYAIYDNGTLTNTGSLGSTVTLGTSAVLTNAASGTIEAGTGVTSDGAASTVSNAGLIDGVLSAGVGVSLGAGGTVINQSTGTIIGAGGTAVAFAGGNALLVVDPGASFGGGIVQAAASETNTLELASGGSAGTLTGLGSRYRQFGTIDVNASARWTLTSDTLGSGYTIYDNGTLTNTGSLGSTVSLGANGVLTNEAGGTINAGVGVTGNVAAATVTNAGIIDGYLTTGVGVFLGEGGIVTNQSTGTISALYGIWSQQAATIVNAGSLYGRDEAVKFHAGYTNLLVVDPGASFSGTVNGANAIGAASVSTLQLASAASAGTLSGLGTTIVDFGQVTVASGATWSLTGADTIVSGATLTELGGARLTDISALVNDGAIVLDPSTLTVAGLTGSGSVSIDAGSTLDVQGTIGGSQTLMFDGTGGWLDLGSPAEVAGSVTNFANGETIDLTGINPTSVHYADGMLSFTGGSFALSLASGGALSASAITGGAAVAVCFCANTRILTPSGERPVQQLAVGDLVTTWGGAARPIVWIGIGKVRTTRGRRNAATPVIVRKGALADNVPNRDLRVTKGHAFWLDDVLIPAEFLVNNRSIEWDDRAQHVEFYHIELDTHDVLVANGAAAESYRDDGNRWLFRNANSGWGLPPLEPYAPVLTGGPIVDTTWRRLLHRAGPRPGLPLTDEADLHLLADGQRVDGSLRPGGHCVFDLPRCPAELRVVSRAGSPAELGLARDPRVLGVAARQVRLWQGSRLRVLDAADESLVDGFHAFEPDNGYRWTDGDAVLPATLFQDIEGGCQLEMLVGGATRYSLSAQAVRRAAA